MVPIVPTPRRRGKRGGEEGPRADPTGASEAASAGAPAPPDDARAERRAIEEAVRRVFAPHLAPSARRWAWRELGRRWRHLLRSLRPLGAVSAGNRVELFCDGDALFEAMWQAIDGARRSVRLAVYTLEPDGVGRRTLDALERAAARGVDVALRVDGLGSIRLGEEWLEGLREAGGRVSVFNPIAGAATRPSRWMTRDHRKVLVVDDAVAFCGGMNVSEDYAGERHGNGLFRDAHLRLEGPAVLHLAALLSDDPLALRPRFERAPRASEGALVQVLESNVRRRRRAIQRALRVILARAGERCWITTPYFVPPPRLRRALTRAAARGIDVRVLTAGRSDVPMARIASRHVHGRLLRGGVRIYEMNDRVLHAKTAAVDGVWSLVGSFNLDVLSDRHNLEVTVGVLGADLAHRLEESFRSGLELSREVTLESWERRGLLTRLLQWLVYRVASAL